MDQPMKNRDFDYDSYRLEPSLESERAPDAAGYWFLAAVLSAFIAAGIIIYRASDTEIQTAANYSIHPTAQTSQLDPRSIPQAR
jgi:hypothetical protein